MIMLAHGPNLNLLGVREPEIYGSSTLSEINASFLRRCEEHGVTAKAVNSNHEGGLVEFVHEAITENYGALVINPGAYCHTSIALRDALAAFDGFKVEVHISNIHARETFRRRSYTGAVVDAVIVGLGTDGYLAALDACAATLKNRANGKKNKR